MFGAYIHIPYCRRLCPYCDFVREQAAGPVPRGFIDALCREIGSFAGPNVAGSVFIGGGTPSLVLPADLARILDAVRGRLRLADAEITVEANPDDVTGELVRAWMDAGVTRVSLGVQSFDDRVLRYLGRRHDAAGAIAACKTVARHFENWAMDLIFGAPPVDAWDATLRRCIELGPGHVSAYGLTFEPSTPLYSRRRDAVDEEQWVDLYRRAESTLNGYVHYEISNYAKPGRECRHNLIYWRNEPYAGFGPGAYSFLDGARARNTVGVRNYIAAPGNKQERIVLSERETRAETVIQHMRLKAGLSKAYYRERFGSELRADFGPRMDDLIARGLLFEDDERIAPTKAGFELNNEIGLALVG